MTIAIFKQFCMFTGVGAIGTLAHYTVLVTGVELLGISVLTSTLIGSIVGALVNYVLNYKFTFNSQQPHHIAVTKFLIVAGIGVVLNFCFMYLGTSFLAVPYISAQILSTGLTLLWNYTINRVWTFNEA
jgi:putative flippase GtrA